MSAGDSVPTMPKSTSPSRPSGSTKMFAGCGSPWKTPWRKIISSHVSASSIASRRRSSIGSDTRSSSPSFGPPDPLQRQHPLAGVRPVHLGDRARGRSRRSCGASRRRCAPRAVVELAADRPRELVDQRLDVDEVEALHALLDARRATRRSSTRSASIWAGAFGRCTLTATWRPFGSSARCTWPIEPAATGTGSKRREQFADAGLQLAGGSPPPPPRTGTARPCPAAAGARRSPRAARDPGASRAAGRT